MCLLVRRYETVRVIGSMSICGAQATSRQVGIGLEGSTCTAAVAFLASVHSKGHLIHRDLLQLRFEQVSIDSWQQVSHALVRRRRLLRCLGIAGGGAVNALENAGLSGL